MCLCISMCGKTLRVCCIIMFYSIVAGTYTYYIHYQLMCMYNYNIFMYGKIVLSVFYLYLMVYSILFRKWVLTLKQADMVNAGRIRNAKPHRII